LTGGSWEASGTGTLSLLSGPIITDNATITLNGTASAFESGSGTPQTIDNTLTTVGTSGVLNLLGGRNFQTSDSLVVGGTVQLGGGTLTAANSGVIINVGGRIVGSGTLDPGTGVADAGVIEAEGGTLAVPQSGILSGAGTLQVDALASLVLTANSNPYGERIINNGTIDAAFSGISGKLEMSGSYSGTGGFLVQGSSLGGTTILELPVNLSANVAFDTNAGELLLDFAPSFNGTVSGFGNSNTIVMDDIGDAVSATLSGDVLTINGSGVTQKITLNVSSMNYTDAVWTVSDNVNDTVATLKVSGVTPAACYVKGTRIMTETGEVAVEQLAVGDVVHAHFAGSTRIVWIGHRHVNCRRHPKPVNVWPVRVAAHAFGPRMPQRDLLLSPDHAVFLDDALIPIKHLINNKTIVQEKVDTVTYYHVELGEHDVLLAEGLPAESYLENGNRSAFDNVSDVVSLYPDFGGRRREAFGCAPLVVTGAKLDAVIARANARVPNNHRTARKIRRVA